MRRHLLVPAAALAAVLTLGACSDDSTATPPAAAEGTAADATAGGVTVLAPEEAVAEIAAGEAVVIDVRTPEEFAAGRVEGAVNVNVGEGGFVDRAEAELAEGDTVLVYCRSGNRSADAAAQLSAAGWTVLDAGGLADLAAAGAPVSGTTG